MSREIGSVALAHLALVLIAASPAVCLAAEGDSASRARAILAATGVKGGLVVHLGCGDGEDTAALRANDGTIVHGLDSDAANVAAARRAVRAAGVYGTVSIDRLTGSRLPYIDGVVNLVVVENLGAVSMAEVRRVLCPGGVAYVRQGKGWAKTVKPRPGNIDEWTHYMHDATGNAVSNDTVIGPPRRLQWVGGPAWSRHHEHMSSLSALVSSGGRIFYIFDEGSRASIQMPPKWKLIARDAFNGCILWKRDIPLWYTHLYPLKSGPAQLPRRLVAVGETVYVTLGLDQPLIALDAATGETIRTYEGTAATEEVLASEGVLFVVVNTEPVRPDRYTWNVPICWDEGGRVARERPWNRKGRTLMALEADTGKKLWSIEATIAPVTLALPTYRMFERGISGNMPIVIALSASI